jgi:adenylosuccinate lyase
LEQARGAREGAGLTYSSPLSQRYASPAMQALWGERRRIGLWRRLWLALMEVERELGLDIPERALVELRAHLDDADLERAAEYEKRLRHDVMAHIHHLGEQAPAARAFLHLGATSAYVTDNTDLILMREGLQLLLGRIAAVLVALAKLARRERAVPCLAYTHFQPAQLTTVGKRVTLWMQEFLLDAEELLHRLDTLQFRGVKGTTGTQASFLELFDGDDEKVRELDARVALKMGFAKVFPVTGQTYTRKLDAQVLAVLAGVAQSAAKLATDLRLLQHEGEMLEPFESDQVGSSAMAYKRNPMRAERITGLARFVIELEGNAWHTAAEQWLERTLDDSANRRLVLPEAFLASDAILVLATNVAAGLEVREAVIARHVAAQLPFLATEQLLMRGVKAGGDRQRLHEVIRTHSLAVAQAMAEQGAANDLLERLARDPAFKALHVALAVDELDPAAYVGRAPRQVDEFLERVLPGVLHRIEAVAPAVATAEVNV